MTNTATAPTTPGQPVPVPPDVPDRSDGLDARLVSIGAVVVLGTIMAILDATIVNVGTRALGEHFHASISTIQWVLTGYLLGLATAIPVTGWAGERFGAKRVWIAALVLFVAGSALAGVAWSVGSLITFRVLQGVGGGMILPVGQAILAHAAGPQRMGRVMGLIGLPMMIGSVAGPVIGGLIVSTVSWRWMFFINLPVGAAAVVLAVRLLPETTPRRDARLDLRGLLLLCSAVTSFVYGMSEAGIRGFDAGRTWAFLGAAAALITLYAGHARSRGERALIDIALFRYRGFTAAVMTNLVVAVALFGVLVLVPLYWQVVRGQSALATGVLLVPQALGAALAMPLAGKVTDRAGAGIVVPVGILLALAGTGAYTQVSAGSSYVLLAAALFVTGLGLGAMISPLMAAVYQGLPRHAIGKATSVLHTIQRLGASVGTTVLAVVLQHGIAERAPQLGEAALRPLPDATRASVAPALADAFSAAFWLAFALTALALVPAVRLPRTTRRTANATPDNPHTPAARSGKES
jgi:EmrB/QacA subfamily drug resistance transporter